MVTVFADGFISIIPMTYKIRKPVQTANFLNRIKTLIDGMVKVFYIFHHLPFDKTEQHSPRTKSSERS